MNIKKLAPWNWFKNEEDETGPAIPVKLDNMPTGYPASNIQNSIVQLHHEMGRFFENAFRGFGLSPFRSDFFSPLSAASALKPQVDIGATDKEYSITVEVPGVSEKDVKLEIANNTMTIRGEKKQETEEKDKNYYRVECSYGSFQRVLSLPEDADQEKIKATFKNGVLTIKMPRRVLPEANVKQIEIKGA